MYKIPIHYKDDEFLNDFGTSCYINKEKMVEYFPYYRHDFIEVSLILEGNGKEFINEQAYDIGPGSISVTFPWHFHTVHADSDAPIRRFICEFSMEDYLQYAAIWPNAKQMIHDKDFIPCLQLDADALTDITQVFNQMYTLFTGTQEDKQTLLYLKLVEFMILYNTAQEAYKKTQEQESAAPTLLAEDKAIHAALHYMHTNFANDITINDLSTAVGVPANTINEQLQAYTGLKFIPLLTDIRIRNACGLLGQQIPTIKYIAANTGFNSIQSFYRTFKDKKGMTPEEFRKKHWQTNEGKTGYIMQHNKVWEIIYFVNMKFDQDITPEIVANALDMSVSYLHKILKENSMQTFSELLHEIRINYSTGLLLFTDYTIMQIAIEVGYNNVKTFVRAFQKMKGCTPSEFREQQAQKQ